MLNIQAFIRNTPGLMLHTLMIRIHLINLIFNGCLRGFVKFYLYPLHSLFNNANFKFLSFVVYLQ